MNYNNRVKPILAVQHALELFEVFKSANKQDEFGVTDLSKRLGLHKNNVFRLLATLTSDGYIEQNQDNENYSLGIGIFKLGQRFVNKLGFIKIARPFMERLVAEINESVYIGTIRGGNVVYLDMVEGNNPVKIISRVGRDVPAYCTSIGKIQLAFSSNADSELYYKHLKMEKFTPNTIPTVTDLRKHISEVLTNGYAVDNEEFEKDVRCLAVPVKDYQGVAVAAISVAGPVFRFSDERMQSEILHITKKYAKEISKRLGYVE